MKVEEWWSSEEMSPAPATTLLMRREKKCGVFFLFRGEREREIVCGVMKLLYFGEYEEREFL